MKTNMGKVFTTLLCMMMCLSLYAQEFTLGMVVGLWNFSAPDAPYGYQKGTCQIKKTGENLSAVFTINDTEMTVKEIKKESDTYKCNFYVDGTYVSLTFIQEGKNKLTGKANAEGMVIPVTFTKSCPSTIIFFYLCLLSLVLCSRVLPQAIFCAKSNFCKRSANLFLIRSFCFFSFWEYLSVRIRILSIILSRWAVRHSCLPWLVR